MTKFLLSFALAVVTLSVAPKASKGADTDSLCPLGNATLRGTYMVIGGGHNCGRWVRHGSRNHHLRWEGKQR
jgi:hypothetical protein